MAARLERSDSTNANRPVGDVSGLIPIGTIHLSPVSVAPYRNGSGWFSIRTLITALGSLAIDKLRHARTRRRMRGQAMSPTRSARENPLPSEGLPESRAEYGTARKIVPYFLRLAESSRLAEDGVGVREGHLHGSVSAPFAGEPRLNQLT